MINRRSESVYADIGGGVEEEGGREGEEGLEGRNWREAPRGPNEITSNVIASPICIFVSGGTKESRDWGC